MFSNFNLLYLPECLMMKNIPHDREKRTSHSKPINKLMQSNYSPKFTNFIPLVHVQFKTCFGAVTHRIFLMISLGNCHTNHQKSLLFLKTSCEITPQQPPEKKTKKTRTHISRPPSLVLGLPKTVPCRVPWLRVAKQLKTEWQPKCWLNISLEKTGRFPA